MARAKADLTIQPIAGVSPLRKNLLAYHDSGNRCFVKPVYAWKWLFDHKNATFMHVAMRRAQFLIRQQVFRARTAGKRAYASSKYVMPSYSFMFRRNVFFSL